MNQNWVRDFVETYLDIQQCQIIEKDPGYTQVKLSVDADKDLTNRPYYWTFVERTGTEPETLTMNFIFNPDKVPQNLRGEQLNFGSRRLQQIFHSTKKRGRIVRLYQQPARLIGRNRHPSSQINTLYPWLGVNYKIEFLSDKKKDKLLSLGINLASGEMKGNFLSILNQIELSPVLPFNVSAPKPFINIREAALQLEEWALHEINKEDFNWAIEAEHRLQEELDQVERYYEMTLDKTLEEKSDKAQSEAAQNNDDEGKKAAEELRVEKQQRIDEIRWQYAPRVQVKPINFGVFYLSHYSLKNVEYKH